MSVILNLFSNLKKSNHNFWVQEQQLKLRQLVQKHQLPVSNVIEVHINQIPTLS